MPKDTLILIEELFKLIKMQKEFTDILNKRIDLLEQNSFRKVSD
jgi:predicted nucleotidyltransferase